MKGGLTCRFPALPEKISPLLQKNQNANKNFRFFFKKADRKIQQNSIFLTRISSKSILENFFAELFPEFFLGNCEKLCIPGPGNFRQVRL